MKKKTVAQLKRELKPIFSRYIRLRDCLRTTGSPDYGECISCDETKPFALLDAGHFVPKHNGNLFSERGVNAQCRKCNRYFGGNQLSYRRGIVERYGEGVDLELEEEARQIKKFTVSELKEMIGDYREKIRLLEEL